MRYLLFFSFFFSILYAGKPVVLVSLSPYRFLVEKISNDAVTVKVIAPQNFDPHNFEPTLKHMENLTDGDIWFCIGEIFENKVKKILSVENPKMQTIDLRDNLKNTIKKKNDRHFWLSIPIVKIQAESIANALIKRYPDLSSEFKANLSLFLKDMDILHAEVKEKLKSDTAKAILVTHPAFFYFCQEYGLKQISIETHGREPTLKEIEAICKEAAEIKIKNIIIQPQHPVKGAKQIAEKLKIKTLMIDPYDKNFINSIKMLTQIIASAND
jgi:zinc transport system substrate-binding protein